MCVLFTCVLEFLWSHVKLINRKWWILDDLETQGGKIHFQKKLMNTLCKRKRSSKMTAPPWPWNGQKPSPRNMCIYIYIKTNTCMPFYIYIIAFSIHKQRNSRLAISCCSLVFTEKSTEKTRLCKLGAPYHPSLAFRPGQQRFRNLWGIRWLPELV